MSRRTTDDLDRIEVVRGSGGALYGSQAIGGVVNLITREGRARPLQPATAGRQSRHPESGGDLRGCGRQARLLRRAIVFLDQRLSHPERQFDNLSGVLRLDYHLSDNTTIRASRATLARTSAWQIFRTSSIANNPNAHQRNEFMFYKGEIDHEIWRSSGRRIQRLLRPRRIAPEPVPFPRRSAVRRPTRNRHVPDETRGANQEASTPGARTFARWSASTSRIAGCTRQESVQSSVRCAADADRLTVFTRGARNTPVTSNRKDDCSTAI